MNGSFGPPIALTPGSEAQIAENRRKTRHGTRRAGNTYTHRPCSGAVAGPKPSPELQSLLAADTLDRQVGDAAVRAAVRAFYTADGHDPRLESRRSRPTQTDAALAVLASARAHGLDPQAYQLAALTAERDVLARKPSRGAAAAAGSVRRAPDGRADSSGPRCGRRPDRRPRASTAAGSPSARCRIWPSTLAAARDDVSQWLPAIQPRHPEYAALMGASGRTAGRRSQGWLARPARRRARTGRLASRRGRAAQAACGLRRSRRGLGRRQPVRPVAGTRRARLPGTSRPAARPDGSTPKTRRGPERAARRRASGRSRSTSNAGAGCPTTSARVTSA